MSTKTLSIDMHNVLVGFPSGIARLSAGHAILHLPPLHGALENPSAWSDKLLWVKRHLGPSAHQRLILSHHTIQRSSLPGGRPHQEWFSTRPETHS